MNHRLKKNSSSKRGVVLLISVLVASVVLAVGIGVYQRTYKELYFGSFWKQTQISAAAADSGIECALYFELHPTEPPFCFGSSVTGWDPAVAPATLQINTGGVCVRVEITTTGTATTTKARGYNADCITVDAGTSPRVVERGLEFTYGSS